MYCYSNNMRNQSHNNILLSNFKITIYVNITIGSQDVDNQMELNKKNKGM